MLLVQRLPLARTATKAHGGVYRTPNTIIAAWISTLCTCIFAGVAFVPNQGQLFAAIVALYFLDLTWRFWLRGVRVRGDGVTVGGWPFARSVAWSDIERFTVEPAGSNPYVGRLIRNDGLPSIAIGAISGGPRTKKSRQRPQPVIDLLNQALEDWRSGLGHQGPHTAA